VIGLVFGLVSGSTAAIRRHHWSIASWWHTAADLATKR